MKPTKAPETESLKTYPLHWHSHFKGNPQAFNPALFSTQKIRGMAPPNSVTPDFSPWQRKQFDITKSRRLDTFCNTGLQSV